jgi:acyl-CoA thioesterase FadM
MKPFNTDFEDISPSGIVHLEKIVEWMSMGREQFFRSTCPNHLWLADRKIVIFTATMSITILDESKWTDTIRSDIFTSQVKRFSYVIHFSFFNTRIKKLIANGIRKVVCINSETEKFAPLSENIKNVVSKCSEIDKI